MQIIRPILVASIVACVFYASSAAAFRCGTRIVTEGEDIDFVYRICGEPASARHWTEVRIRPVYRYSRFHPVSVPVEVTVEEWTYNLGARRFMRRLRFENGRLVRIRELRYGY